MIQDMKTRSKIYTYFYGRNTIFQQFLIVVGVLFVLLKQAADMAIMQHRYQNYTSNSGDPFPLGTILNVLGILLVAAGLLWIIYKKISFNKVGEQDYDNELAFRVEEAKKKGMEKLNIIVEQIERVEPVVLHGVAQMDNPLVRASKGFLKGAIGRVFLALEVIILGFLCSIIVSAIAFATAKNLAIFIIALILILAGCGALGYLFYKKFEMDSSVSPRVIEKLRRLNPNLISKLGSDDKVRVSCPSITVYMFGDDQLYMYYQYIDLVTGEIFCEGVHEYFYEDIVGVTSAQEVKKIFKRYGFLRLFLKSVSYLRESITVVTSGCVHGESFIVDMGHSLLDTQFIGMRNLIRQKKAEK